VPKSKAPKSKAPKPSKTAAAKTEREVVKLVAQQLGNTPAVARRSYVDPVVFEKHSAGKTLATSGRLFKKLSKADHKRIREGRPLSLKGRQVVEKAVLRLLSGTDREDPGAALTSAADGSSSAG
jgi:DNA topoisomerase I